MHLESAIRLFKEMVQSHPSTPLISPQFSAWSAQQEVEGILEQKKRQSTRAGRKGDHFKTVIVGHLECKADRHGSNGSMWLREGKTSGASAFCCLLLDKPRSTGCAMQQHGCREGGNWPGMRGRVCNPHMNKNYQQQSGSEAIHLPCDPQTTTPQPKTTNHKKERPGADTSPVARPSSTQPKLTERISENQHTGSLGWWHIERRKWNRGCCKVLEEW
jgi:hypothetical protein